MSIALCVLVLGVGYAADRQGWSAPLPRAAQDATTIFLGIVAEALPFVLIGGLVSALIRRFASPARLGRLVPRSPLLAFPAVASLGLLLPVCECGNVPVARQLVRQGLRPSYAITFLLASPIFNPAVIITTYVAFRADLRVFYGRFALGLVVAMLVGGYFYLRGDRDLLREDPPLSHTSDGATCDPDDHAHGGIVAEFLELFTALCVGAAIAAAIQTVVPYGTLASVGDAAVLSILAMMALAVLVSICSTVDAFFALAYTTTFSSSALLAFLVLGPMIDLKAIAMLQQSWTRRTVLAMALLVGELVFAASFALQFWGVL